MAADAHPDVEGVELALIVMARKLSWDPSVAGRSSTTEAFNGKMPENPLKFWEFPQTDD